MCDIGILGRGIRIGLMVWSGCKSVVLVRGCGIGLMVRYLQEDCDVVMVMAFFFYLEVCMISPDTDMKPCLSHISLCH